jgi:hypothetical protein
MANLLHSSALSVYSSLIRLILFSAIIASNLLSHLFQSPCLITSRFAYFKWLHILLLSLWKQQGILRLPLFSWAEVKLYTTKLYKSWVLIIFNLVHVTDIRLFCVWSSAEKWAGLQCILIVQMLQVVWNQRIVILLSIGMESIREYRSYDLAQNSAYGLWVV